VQIGGDERQQKVEEIENNSQIGKNS